MEERDVSAAAAGPAASVPPPPLPPPSSSPRPPGLAAPPSPESGSASSAGTEPEAALLSKPLLMQLQQRQQPHGGDDDHDEVRTPAPVPPLGAGASPPSSSPADEEVEAEEEAEAEGRRAATTPTQPHDAIAAAASDEDDVAPPGLELPPTEGAEGQRTMTMLAEPAVTPSSPASPVIHRHDHHQQQQQEQQLARPDSCPSSPTASTTAAPLAAAAAAAAAAEVEARVGLEDGEEDGVEVEDDEPVAPPPPARGKKLSLSVIACLSYMSMGGIMGLLGPSIPLMARALDVAETALGGAFAARAGGYILGSALVSRIPERCWSRLGVMGVAGMVASVLNAAMPYSGRLAVLLPICFAQGVGLAIISTLGNIVLLELWGAGAGPWLQALHFSFGVGAVVSPLVLGVAGLVPAFSAFAAVGLLPFIAVAALDACCSILPACSPAHRRRQRAASLQGASSVSGSHRSGSLMARSRSPPASRVRASSARRLRQGEEAFDHRAPLTHSASGKANRQRRRTFSPGPFGGRSHGEGSKGNSSGLGRAPLLLYDGQQEGLWSAHSDDGGDEEEEMERDRDDDGVRVRRLTLEDLLPETLLMGTAAAMQGQQQQQQQEEEDGGVELGPLLLSPNAAARAAAVQAAAHASHHPFTLAHPAPRYSASPTGSGGGRAGQVLVVPSPLHNAGGAGANHHNFFSNTSEITVASSLTMTTGQFRSTGGAYPGRGGLPAAAAAHYLGRDEGEDEEGEGEGGAAAGAAARPQRNSWGRRAGAGAARPQGGQGQRQRSGGWPVGVGVGNGGNGAAAMHAHGGHGHGHGHGHGPAVMGPLAPLPTSLRWLLTTFLGLYVGAECGFGGWVSTYVLLEKTTNSERQAAFLVSIFWAAITLGRALAVLQAMLIPAAWSLRIQMCLSLGGALAFFITGSVSVAAAAACAAVYGYGMSSVYPLVMTWPAEAGFGLDAAATAHLVIGGCIGEATMPVLIGAGVHVLGPRALPCAVLGLAVVLCAQLALVDCLGKRRAAAVAAAGGGAGASGGGAEGASVASSVGPGQRGSGGGGGKGKGKDKGKGGGSLESPIRTFDLDDEEDVEMGSRLGVGAAIGIEEVSLAGTEAGHLSAASICTPGHPYLFLYDVAR